MRVVTNRKEVKVGNCAFVLNKFDDGTIKCTADEEFGGSINIEATSAAVETFGKVLVAFAGVE